jgi:hypothetical protein
MGDSKADYKVHEIRVLPGRPEAASVKELLQRLARQVQPIMRRRGWKVSGGRAAAAS